MRSIDITHKKRIKHLLRSPKAFLHQALTQHSSLWIRLFLQNLPFLLHHQSLKQQIIFKEMIIEYSAKKYLHLGRTQRKSFSSNARYPVAVMLELLPNTVFQHISYLVHLWHKCRHSRQFQQRMVDATIIFRHWFQIQKKIKEFKKLSYIKISKHISISYTGTTSMCEFNIIDGNFGWLPFQVITKTGFCWLVG